MFRKLLAPLASLRLTVVLIVLSMFLIYAGTWAQKDQGIWQVQAKYFHSLVCGVDPAIFLPRTTDGGLRSLHFPFLGVQRTVQIPMLGGYTLGLLLLVNLLSAHALRFKGKWWDLLLIPAIALCVYIASQFNADGFWPLVAILTLSPLPILATIAPLHGKRTGVIMIHLGLIMLLVGEGVTSGLAVESKMPIREGNTAIYSLDARDVELAIVDESPAENNKLMSIPSSMLKTGTTISDAQLPVDIKVDSYYANSRIKGPKEKSKAEARATAGIAQSIRVEPMPHVTGVDMDGDIDFPSAYVTLSHKGESLGTYLLSAHIDPSTWDPIVPSQTFDVDGKTYKIDLRFKRLYKPYHVKLLEFTHDKYLGTETAKDFASRIRLVDTTPGRGTDREVRIWMNNPLRYHGETFYQASFMPDDRGTVLQIVTNPGWLMPYVACAIGAIGLLIHFGIKLFGFIRKTAKSGTTASNSLQATPARASATPWYGLPTLASIGLIFVVLGMAAFTTLRPPGPKTDYDLKTFGSLPVLNDGRVQPLDSLARTSLKVIAGRERAVLKDGTRISPTRWLLDVFGKGEQAADYPVFRIDNPETLSMLKLDPKEKYFSFNELLAQRDELQKQFASAQNTASKDRDVVQRRVVELGQGLSTYIKLARMRELLLSPPMKSGDKWLSLGESITREQVIHPAGEVYLDLVEAIGADKPADFNKDVRDWSAKVSSAMPKEAKKAQFEAEFNHVDPFTLCIALYLVSFVLACLGLLFVSPAMRRGATVGVLLALAIHTVGLIARVYISGRPPVTNLTASAIFIAWGAVILAIGLELFYRNGIGSIAATIMGACSLLIADRLALSGDTLNVLQAVLDTNFWLATHVIMITMGYAATFLAGILAIIYVFMWLLRGRNASDPALKDLVRMVYGITCFAILFSFVGTILGGIWADQSWGRFWGWDPKENGAVLIVLANALLLHARWAGIARDRGIVGLALFGNIVTSWSWFGTNMLGVGLHSYGFMESAFWVLISFVASQIVLIGLLFIPRMSRTAGGKPMPATAT